jgi:cytochrome c6
VRKMSIIIMALCGVTFLMITASRSTDAAARTGEDLFKEHCAACHPNGSNIVNPKKTLQKKDLEANKIRSADDIVGIMRNPGPGMLTFDSKTISDKDAHLIAEFILSTFAK